MTDSLNRLTAAIKAGKRKDARAATAEALEAGLSPTTVDLRNIFSNNSLNY